MDPGIANHAGSRRNRISRRPEDGKKKTEIFKNKDGRILRCRNPNFSKSRKISKTGGIPPLDTDDSGADFSTESQVVEEIEKIGDLHTSKELKDEEEVPSIDDEEVSEDSVEEEGHSYEDEDGLEDEEGSVYGEEDGGSEVEKKDSYIDEESLEGIDSPIRDNMCNIVQPKTPKVTAGEDDEISSEDEPCDRQISSLALASSSTKCRSFMFDSGYSNTEWEKNPLMEIPAPKKVSGKTFRAMGLSANILKAITRKGYRLPSPIQRLCIPVILSGRDVVGMARTGSGKTAAFVIPMLELLKVHSTRVGSRALVISPSRELALQTFKFLKELSALTDLRTCLIVGGDNLDDHFTAITGNPDIIVATPGRLMHLVIEMNLKFSMVEYVVFDEADRLFEMGFSAQLHELLARIPVKRQMLLFSATMPKTLLEFAKAGLVDPVLARLDADFCVPKDLQTHFLGVREETRDAVLILALETLVKESEVTIVFVPTKYFAEYIDYLLRKEGFNSTYIHGSLDQSSRTSRINMFRAGKVKILVVTDLAARGIDIPLLDCVINYMFPSSSKLFVNRVGRTARAGRKGTTYSLMAFSELPYLLDLQILIGRPMVLCPQSVPISDEDSFSLFSGMIYGSVPQSIVGLKTEKIFKDIQGDEGLSSMKKAALNSYKKYLLSAPPPSKESISRAKMMFSDKIGVHPLFKGSLQGEGIVFEEKSRILESISNFRPPETVFEVMSNGKKMSVGAMCMKRRREKLCKFIGKSRSLRKKILTGAPISAPSESIRYGDIIENPSLCGVGTPDRGLNLHTKDFIPYIKNDSNTEKGYSITNSSYFAENLRRAELSLTRRSNFGAEGNEAKPRTVWDSKKHRFKTLTVGSDNKKMIRSESGALVPISFKSNRFEEWKRKCGIAVPKVGDREAESCSAVGVNSMKMLGRNRRNFGISKNNTQKNSSYKGVNKKGGSGISRNEPKEEIKTTQQIVREKLLREKMRERMERNIKKGKNVKKRRSKGSSRKFSNGGSKRSDLKVAFKKNSGEKKGVGSRLNRKFTSKFSKRKS